MITRIDDYFTKGCGRCARFDTPDCSTKLWHDGLHALRRICRDAGLSETVKWGHPCYRLGERNIALIGAFQGDFRLNFMNPALMTDPEGVLEKAGPNTQTAGMIRFRDAADVMRLEPVIRAYLAEAMDYAKAGITPPRQTAEVELPQALVEALDADPDLAEAFHGLTPGRQRSYVIAVNSAKKLETKVARIAAYRDRIIAGKGAQER